MQKYHENVPNDRNVFRFNSNSSHVIDAYGQNMLNGELSRNFCTSNNKSGNNHLNRLSKKSNASNDSKRSSSYSLLDALTNAVTSNSCSGAVYPVNDPDDTRRLSENEVFVVSQESSKHQQQPRQQYQEPSTSTQRLTSPLIGATTYRNYNRQHQFPSVNYKNSYLLWIGTPVAARYTLVDGYAPQTI